ncbi:undecaprenyl-diphosphate phosphatase [Marinilactibacillus psychrotolerans]|uniref:Undecaprenyl-diphosphatase n=1 Tax=Marinilactibacillus psychrotolerans TaxID=191770 RepID=A0A511H3E6_9LACT|nr:undecaprenyl-diphosphate phosphatase [Marinilactibacillus psychrotolerans]TLQ06453.1 undecaprenyl-diphosphate phosphatase [Marinilactibacillus psychrotolerans]SDD33278.1 Undecaprenyl-diphosphatase [Marinilactibacillus psychrotolerans]GEL68042.1 undecaprenyl-diphosphatase [Marinilactibacillus psychrotolerans]GEQ32788.1 UDP pyrophosphate phosphatase [Marinilactibacillus psychrotolerans]GEQ36653.1 UDP pyrophosphate phosphatase [Marinilactibacillus psychrotolerans]
MLLIEIFKSILLGIVQGITEWLPISSTGHMILFDEFLVLDTTPEFKTMFMVVIQLASILAVILLFFNKLNPFAPSKDDVQKKETWDIWFKVLVGIIPAGVIGLLFDDLINEHFYNWITVSITLIVYGIAFIVIEKRNKNKHPKVSTFNDLTYKMALIIGFFQVLALIPGTSRSGATIVGAILIGIARPIAAEYSFFLSVPIMLGASIVKLGKFGFNFTSSELIILLVGCVVSFIVSVFAIKFLMSYIRRHDFSSFGWYRIVVGILVIGYFMIIG